MIEQCICADCCISACSFPVEWQIFFSLIMVGFALGLFAGLILWRKYD